VTQSIFKGGSIWHSISAAKHALGAVRNQRTDSEQAVILGVREAYFNALLAERTARIAALSLEQAETELERVRLRRDAGQASEFTLLQAEVERGNQVPIVKQTEAQRRIAQLELARLAHLPRRAAAAEHAALERRRDPRGARGRRHDRSRRRRTVRGRLSIEEELRARERASPGSRQWPDVSLFAN
jgi:outer membrane protein TolC